MLVITSSTYYSAVALNGTPDATSATHNAVAGSNYTNDIRDYSSAVGQTTAGVFSSIICEMNTPTTTISYPAVTAGVVGACGTGSRPVGQ
ncbi:MAG: hypothetical protein EWV53_01620 [Microcystis panniformis Mp_MB_F_20051200_S9]|uniref:Uncharacterized protein n=1 Tax=Microcystis panniformis Mp_MB_F_20051200_S9 TaxID=2486223 RepID=A0A552QAC8_9CHRO|nr:MAG: hypothetical protein EWV86_14650 [Microcystis panniformis Mp_MB_F_20051200_S9D]TRV66154.1 MAG: hypothetical protein EWV53_01620 [Microcystis panniformis Mp_MB_F_20051200_S9]